MRVSGVGLLVSLLLLTVVSSTAPPTIKLTEKNFVVIRGPIDGMSSARVIDQLLRAQHEKELYVYIISPGGSVLNGMEIVRTMRSLSDSGVSIKCVADTALSMGFVIFQYCPVRYVTMSSVLMQHQMNMGIRGPINQVVNYISFIKSIEESVDTFQADRMGKTLDQFHALTGHDWWSFGKNSVTENAADMMVNVMCDFDPQPVEEIYHTPFGDAVVTYSNCPLARSPLKVSFDGAEEVEVRAMFDPDNYVLERMGMGAGRSSPTMSPPVL